MSNTKYISSGGLAFAEERDMKKLRRFSRKGWHVRNFKFMGYTLEKGACEDFIYSVDYRSLKDGEAAEYFEFFSASGWTHVASEQNIHLFRALPGTNPIYSDDSTVADKHNNLGVSFRWTCLALLGVSILLWIGAFFSSETLKMILTGSATLISIIVLPLCWTLLTIFRNKWEAEGKKGAVYIAKSIPILLLAAALLCLVTIGNTSYTVSVITSMIIGAIAFPTLIWLVMSFWTKVTGR